MKTHDLKITQEYFLAKLQGIKPFEVRINDREYEIGDILVLHELNEDMECTGRTITQSVNYKFENPDYLPKGYVILSGEIIAIEFSKVF